jgi:hypothetical protein
MTVNLYKANVYVLKNVGASKYSHIIKLLKSNERLLIFSADPKDVNLEIIKLLKEAYGVNTEFVVKALPDISCDSIKGWNYVLVENEVNFKLLERLNDCGIENYNMIENYRRV